MTGDLVDDALLGLILLGAFMAILYFLFGRDNES